MNEYSTLFLAQINEKQNDPAALDKKKADDKKKLEDKKKAREARISQLKVGFIFFNFIDMRQQKYLGDQQGRNTQTVGANRFSAQKLENSSNNNSMQQRATQGQINQRSLILSNDGSPDNRVNIICKMF